MSAINDALAKLAKQSSDSKMAITKAEVAPVKRRSVLPWVVGSFGLSLAVGGWAISQQAPMPPAYDVLEPAINHVELASPTQKVTLSQQPLYQVEKGPAHSSKANGVKETPQITAQPSVEAQPLQLAKNSTVSNNAVNTTSAPSGQVVIEQVELTPQQLSDKAQQRAKKALDSNNLSEALSQYSEALRYTPADTQVRKRLSALYYGKGEVRKAAEILQKGIALNSESSDLRLSLAKMLMKEQQNGVALTVLSAMPSSASTEYLALRAALAQKEKQDAMALESYQKLVAREPDSARWWLGLGIQQERAFNLAAAKSSYTEALTKLGLSNQSQQFIRDRLTLIAQLEDTSSEN